MFFSTAVLNTVSTIAAESSDVTSSAATDDLYNDQDSVEVYYSKKNKNDRYYVQDPITKWNDGNDTKKITTEDIAALVLLELQSQKVKPESQDDLNTNFFCFNPRNILQKKVRRKIGNEFPINSFLHIKRQLCNQFTQEFYGW